MNECNPVECNPIESNSIEVTNTYFSLSDQAKFRLNEITEIKDSVKSSVNTLLLLIILMRL